MSARTLAVWCRDWPLVAAGVVPTDPAAVVVANRVVATTPAARRAGVRSGQRRREAQGRCPELTIVDHDPDRDARAFEVVAGAMDSLAARLEVAEPGRLAVPTRGPSRYAGGDDALAGRVHEVVAEALAGIDAAWIGPSVRVGIADGPVAARLAAAAAPPSEPVRVIAPGATPAFLAPLSVSVLGRPELADVLGRLGVSTLGDLAVLDAGDVLARFGEEGRVAHLVARGAEMHPAHATEPPPELVVEAECDPPTERLDAVAFLAKALADELFARMEALALTAVRVVITLSSEHGEVSERRWRHEGGLDASAVADRVRWQADGWLRGPAARRPSAPLTLVRVGADEVVAARGRQLGFWGGESAATTRAVRAVARVQGLIGPDAVAVPTWAGGRTPAEQVRLVPAHTVELGDPARVVAPPGSGPPWPGRMPGPAPALVHHDPVAVSLVDERGDPVTVSGRGVVSAPPDRLVTPGGEPEQILAWSGPWPCEERWWDPRAHRRRARCQVVLADRAHLVALERGTWWIEATHD